MNRLQYESSPYLLQHADNLVDWMPWNEEAFERAKSEDKPIFLSVGYSTCHWCHVMAHESFEDKEVADILNRYFVSIKVDKEERPDIDAVYMKVCIEATGSGGWPMTIIMSPTGKPFFAGTYFPKESRYGMTGLIELLGIVHEEWENNRQRLIDSADNITDAINRETAPKKAVASKVLIEQGIAYFKSRFDQTYGGFGKAPKFPMPHNLIFLLDAYEKLDNRSCLEMAEKTLISMAKGGIFDHIGFGFSRYSTDEKWLVPHFEKMLYDNALLILAYAKAYKTTQSPFYKSIAQKTISYILSEMENQEGGFYSAQDADSGGVEGSYYVFTPEEVKEALGEEDGEAFIRLYDITDKGNFEGKSIPNLINKNGFAESLDQLLPKLYEYRKERIFLHKDDKILSAWNSLMIAALAEASVIFEDKSLLDEAVKSAEFIEENLFSDGKLYTSFREGKRAGGGILDDYAYYIFALLSLYQAEPKERWLKRAKDLAEIVEDEFYDSENSGYFFTSASNGLIARPKETYDGALPSGNSVMAMNLVILDILTGEYSKQLDRHIAYMSSVASQHPGGYAFLLYSLLVRDYTTRDPSDYVCDENGCRVRIQH